MSFCIFADVTDLLLGLIYYENYGDFAYVGNMQPVTGYLNWFESKDTASRKHCVKLSTNDYKWVDVDCNSTLPFICKGEQKQIKQIKQKVAQAKLRNGNNRDVTFSNANKQSS